MTHSRHALKALGLCLIAALGVMAFAAVSAQAEVGAAWDVNGVKVVKPLLPEVQGETEVLPGTKETHGVMLTEVLKNKVEILCEKTEVDMGLLHESGELTATSLLFFGCITKLNGVTNANCKPKGGEIHTNAIKALIKLHELASGVKDKLVLLAPASGSVFVQMQFESPTCIIELEEGAGMKISGEIWYKDCKGEEEVAQEVRLIEEVKTTLGHLTFGTAGKEISVAGSINLFLIGAHKGMKWRGLWN